MPDRIFITQSRYLTLSFDIPSAVKEMNDIAITDFGFGASIYSNSDLIHFVLSTRDPSEE